MKKKNFAIIAFILFLAAATGYGATNYYVWRDNPAPQTPFTNWAMAATSIQDALDLIVPGAGDTVYVTNGTYATGGRANCPAGGLLTNRVVLAAVTLRSVNGPAVTIIEGAADPGGDANGLGSNAVRCAYLTAGASLIGFTLTNGHTFGASEGTGFDRQGGGVQFYFTGVISNCVLAANKAYDYGGGAMLYGGGRLDNCLLTDGYAGSYGGGASIGGAGTLNYCTLAGNYSGAYGGAVSMDNGSLLNNCVISNNSARYGPGGVTAYLGGGMNNCLVAGNWADTAHPTAGGPGGIDAGGPDTNAFTMNNCTVVNNRAKIRGGGVRFSYQTNNTMNNCIVWGNTCDGDSYSNILISAGCTTIVYNTCSGPVWTNQGVGNIGSDPLLVNTNIGNYRLTANSPCINTGTNQGWMTGAVDLDGQPRIHHGTVDMGAYENQVNKGTIVSIQ